MHKTPPARPNLGLPFASPPPTFPMGVINSSVIFILAPPGQCLSKCWSKPSDVRCPLGNQGLCQPDVWLIRCALRTRYVRLLSGFVGTSGGLAGLVLPLSKCLVTGIPRLIGSFREKEYPSWIMRACDGLSWDTPAGYKLSRAVPAVMWQMGICKCPVGDNLTPDPN